MLAIIINMTNLHRIERIHQTSLQFRYIKVMKEKLRSCYENEYMYLEQIYL